ncbi:MAG: serine/threonine protein phosphatase [Novosphingobium sp.]
MKSLWQLTRRAMLIGGLALALGGTSAAARDESFTIAVIPDTQNYLDYTHQKNEGFPFDASAMFLEQMRYIADNVESRGGDIAFVTSLGDVWQHQTLSIDPEHEKRGFRRIANPMMDKHFAPTDKVRTVEMPMAHKGYSLLDGKVPFSVVPGNHDHDAMWMNALPPSAGRPSGAAATSPRATLHAGGVSNFNAVFGAGSQFFKGRDWYVDSFNGGASSAQIFTAGGYRFLHIGLQFDPPNDVLAWAATVIARYPGLPTIVSTHDYLDTKGRRRPNPMVDNAAIDPQDNSPQMVWDKLISQHDQIFMVLCGHQHAQAFRADYNRFGHKVYQILSDYQSRNQTLKDAGGDPGARTGVGDGWMRLMTFDMAAATPTVLVKTYSTHYRRRSTETPQYVAWYKAQEQPELADAEFVAADDFTITLADFRARFRQTANAE